MGNYEQLKEVIKDIIKQNGRQEITGQILQSTLLSIVSSVGENASFAGVAIPSTVPATSDKNIFYIAGKKGTYANFGGKVVSSEAVIFTNRSGTWASINTGLATLDGVTTSIQSEHAFIEEGLDRLDTELTELKQTDITDMKGDIELNNSEIQKAKNDITKINGEITTLNDATDTAADELVRIEEKIDKSLEDTTIIFSPTVQDGLLRYADIVGFNMSTSRDAIKKYFGTYWEAIEASLKKYKNVNLKAYYGNEDCSSGTYCKPATEYGNIAIDLINYKMRSNNLIEIEYGFIFGGKQKHFNVQKTGGEYNITEYGVKLLKINENRVYAPTYCNGSIIDLKGLINTEEEFETACANSAIVSDANIHTIFTVITKGNAKKLLIIYNYASVNEEYTYQEYHKGAQDIYVRGLKCSRAAGGALDWPVIVFKWETYGVQKITYNNSSKNIIISNYFAKEVSKTGILPFSVQANSIATLEEPIIQ